MNEIQAEESIYSQIHKGQTPIYASKARKTTNPGRRSETSKANAEKARLKRMDELRERQMFESYVRQKAEEMIQAKKSVEDPNLLLKQYMQQPKGKQKKKQEYIEESESDSESESSEEEVIYVAPTQRKKKVIQSGGEKIPTEDMTKKEIEQLRKQLEELKTQKSEPPKEEPKRNKKDDYLDNLRFKILEF